ncbi:MAG: hypothetical protein SPG80_11215 [Candidatus Ventricola sp.]|nr:hypothetical protein [Candidatus Ventricola sp.]
MQSSVGALEGTVTESFDGIVTATDGLLTGFDQSDTAYNNAYNTGIGAANGLSDAPRILVALLSRFWHTVTARNVGFFGSLLTRF